MYSSCSHLPLHKAELEKTITDDINTEGTETRLGQFNCLNVKETPDRKKVRLCFVPKDLNKNVCCENYYSSTIGEILPLLASKNPGKNYFSVVDTTKGYWHVNLNYKSSLLCTFTTFN